MKIPLFPTQLKFVSSDAPIVFLIAPQGEGKTFSGFMAVLYHQKRIGGMVRGAIIRDTFQNIKTMTIPSIQDAIEFCGKSEDPNSFQKVFEWSDGGRKLKGPGIDIDLFGIDDLGSLTKLQGGEYSVIWLEEPAPMWERANAGLSREVFTAALSRVARQRGAKPRLQITMNPADEEHWTYDLAIKNPIMRPPEMPDIWTEVFRIPYGENQFLTDIQRQTAKAAFKNDPALWRRYIGGEFAFAIFGEAVTPEYNEDMHRAKEILAPWDTAKGLRFWDAGFNPTCVIGQIHPVSGRLIIYDTLVGENIGMLQLIRGEAKPLISMKYRKITNWIDTGDPALLTRDQSNTEMSPAQVINAELNATYFPGATDWETRKQAIKYVLTSMPMLLLSKNEEKLHQALRGGWHYAKTNSGEILKDAPLKNIWSHPADALSQGLPVILGSAIRKPKITRRVQKPTEPLAWMAA